MMAKTTIISELSKILIIDDNELIPKALALALKQYYGLKDDQVEIMPNNIYPGKDEVSTFLREHSHEYNVIVNANSSFMKENKEFSYDGILMLLAIFNDEKARKPMIISIQSLRQLKNIENERKILLEDEGLYYYSNLPCNLESFSEFITQGG